VKHLVLLLLAAPPLCFAAPPQCASWPTNMAMVYMKNLGITDPTRLDESKTQAALLASEPGRNGLFRQIYDISFVEHSGKRIEVITSNDASLQECSMGSVTVYIVSRKIEEQDAAYSIEESR
jgi:hypothetical protein